MQGIPDRAWLGYLLAGLTLTGVYYLIPPADAGLAARVGLYVLISVSAVVAILAGLLWHDPDRLSRRPWLLLAVGQGVYTAADLAFYTAHYLLESESFPSLADLLYLAHYPLVVAALTLLIRRRTPGRDLPGLLDAATIAVMAALLSWLFLIRPSASVDLTALGKVATLAYPVMDLAMLAVALRLVFDKGWRPMSFYLLSGSLFLILTADTVYSLQRLDGTYLSGNVLDAVWLAGNLALGAAALHPTAPGLDRPVPRSDRESDRGFGRFRLLAITTAGLAGPLILAEAHGRHGIGGAGATATAWSALFLLVVARMRGLALEQGRIAATDDLTGLRTRRCFQTRLVAEFTKARGSDARLAVFMLDVDHFKMINDRYGHPAGDRALVEIANRLRDAADPDDLLARYGGEEFALLKTSVPTEESFATCERLRERVASAPIMVTDEIAVRVTVSVGAAVDDPCATTPDDLVCRADQALYQAKACGRNRAVVRGVADGGARTSQPARTDGSHRDGGVVTGPERYRPARIGEVATGGDDPQLARWRDPKLGRDVDLLYLAADQVDGWLSQHEHSRAVCHWGRLLAARLGYDDETVLRTELAGRLHDIGKIVVPTAILVKPDALTDGEWRLLQGHPDQGARIASLIPGLGQVAEIIRQHHERFDGDGYPAGLAGDEILPEARILAVCDSWSAMRYERPYHRALPEPAALDELRRGSGTQYAPDAVEAFIELHALGRITEPSGAEPQRLISASVFQNSSS